MSNKTEFVMYDELNLYFPTIKDKLNL